ncbi:dTDP-glucose 4,6-dehydratase [groundwater metagenome]|uniref:UDP-glucuronate decarboxylase n=1 Tax=groundwater metagenome TaxID=717931 RepID=A0A098EEA0_9ZZZZ
MDIKMGEIALVTGGAGFIGSHLCEYLLEKGFKVICVDNLSTGSEENIKHLKNNKNFKFLKKDVREDLDINEKIDYIFDLASRASPKDFRIYPIDILTTNGLGVYNLLKIAEKNKAKFLFSSTSEVYGDPKEHPQKETCWGNVNPIGIRGCYDEAKRFAEAMVMAFVRERVLDARIIRIFNTYGPRLNEYDGRVVSNFITQALKNEPLTVYGDGNQTRSFCYVSDTVEGIYKVMMNGEKGEVYNLGNEEEYKILDIAKIIKNLTNSDSEIVFKDLPEDDPKIRKPDISKARKYLNWESKVKLKEGLERTIEYFKKKI